MRQLERLDLGLQFLDAPRQFVVLHDQDQIPAMNLLSVTHGHAADKAIVGRAQRHLNLGDDDAGRPDVDRAWE